MFKITRLWLIENSSKKGGWFDKQYMIWKKVFGPDAGIMRFGNFQGKLIPDDIRIELEKWGVEGRARQEATRLRNIQKHRPLSELSPQELAERREQKLARRAARKERKNRVRAPRAASGNHVSFAAFSAFYDTPEWRRLRYKVFTLYGRKCACCESVAGPFHIDHIKPRSKFPELELSLSNLQVLCEACNMGKGGWDETDWREPTRGENLWNKEFGEL